MTQTVTIRKLVQTMTDPHAVQSYPTSFTSPSHLSSPSQRRDVTGAGPISSIAGSAYLPPNTEQAIVPGDRLVLPDGTDREILTVDKFYDQDGLHHQVVTFG